MWVSLFGETKRGRREGDGGKGTGKKKTSRQFKPCGLEASRVGRAPLTSSCGAVPAPKCNPLREVRKHSLSLRTADRLPPSPRGRHSLSSEEVRVPPPRGCSGTTLSLIITSKLCFHNFSEKTSVRGTISTGNPDGMADCFPEAWGQGLEPRGSGPTLAVNDSNAKFDISACPVHCTKPPPGSKGQGRANLPRGRARVSNLPPGNESTPT